MTAVEKFLEHLQGQAAKGHDVAARSDWINALSTLRTQISSWLQDGVDQGLVRIEDTETQLREQDFGEYNAPSLVIELLPVQRRLSVEPRGGRVAGFMGMRGGAVVTQARGRVDVISGPDRAVLLRRSDDTWVVAYVDGVNAADWGLPTLDEEVFGRMLQALVP